MELEKLEVIQRLLATAAKQYPVALRELKGAVGAVIEVMKKLELPVPVEFEAGVYRIRWVSGRVVAGRGHSLHCSDELEEMEALLKFPEALLEWLRRVEATSTAALALARALKRALEDEELVGELAMRGLSK